MTDTRSCKPARAVLALIALATELPLPNRIALYAEGEIGAEPVLALDFATINEGIAWAKHLDVEVAPHVNNGYHYLGHRGVDYWHGWRVSLNAHEPVAVPEPDLLTGEETAALAGLAGVAG